MEQQLPPQIGEQCSQNGGYESDESDSGGETNVAHQNSYAGNISTSFQAQGGLQPVPQSIHPGSGLQRVAIARPEEKRGWFSGPTEEEKERRLRAQIKAYVKQNPGLKIDKMSKLDASLQHMDLEALKDIMLNLKSQMGGPGPYESAKTLVDAAASFVEKKFKVRNYGKRCRENAELVSAVDSVCPIDLGDYSAPIQIIVHLAKTLYDCVSEQENVQTTNYTPQQNPCNGSISGGQDNIRSANDSEATISPGNEDDCSMSDMASGDLRPNKRLRTG